MDKCKECSGVFEKRRSWQDFCSARCRDRWHGKARAPTRRFTEPDELPGVAEVWRDIPGYAGSYQASDQGRIRSVHRVVRDGSRSRELSGGVLKPVLLKTGYLVVGLSVGGKMKNYLVQWLVLLAFVGPRPAGWDVCHDDGDRTNNRLANLRYDTRANNLFDMRRHGTYRSGEHHTNAKLTDEQVAAIKEDLRPYESWRRLPSGVATRLALKYGVWNSHISGIRKGRKRAVPSVGAP